MKKGQLLLLPNLLNKEANHTVFLPASVDRAVAQLDGLIAENEKEGRAYLMRFSFPEGKTFRDIEIKLLNKHNKEIEELLMPMREGKIWGLVSDAGLPVIADPGYLLVKRANDYGVSVKAFVGPSSITMALMLSGLQSQAFTFHGYLPKNFSERLKELEERSTKENSTQIFIEAPFRNQNMLEAILKILSDETQLCLAWDLTMPTQGVETHPVKVWKKRSLPNILRRPTVFLFSSNQNYSH